MPWKPTLYCLENNCLSGSVPFRTHDGLNLVKHNSRPHTQQQRRANHGPHRMLEMSEDHRRVPDLRVRSDVKWSHISTQPKGSQPPSGCVKWVRNTGGRPSSKGRRVGVVRSKLTQRNGMWPLNAVLYRILSYRGDA